jgi:hypothetical protein
MNFNDTHVPGIPRAGENVETELALFDDLPRELRDILNYCPIKATATLLYYRIFFSMKYKLRPDIAEQWKAEFRTAFPEYQPIKGDDFPV